MNKAKISKRLLKRLPLYLDYLKNLTEDSSNVSATAIAKHLGLGDVQVRKDLAKVSHAGRSRTGRCREQLIQDIEDYLDYAARIGTILVGAGKLGRALLDYEGFDEVGMNIIAGFDSDPSALSSGCGKPIHPMSRLESFCKHYDVHIGIIAVPAESAQDVCDRLIACGVRASWNFSPALLKVPDHVVVQSENLAISLTSLRMQLKRQSSYQQTNVPFVG